MSSEQLNLHRNNIRTFAKYVEQPGRQHVLQALTQSGKDPFQSIIHLQGELSIGCERLSPALKFLDCLKAPRLAVHVSILESLKDKFLSLIAKLKDDSLLVLLRETYQFMSVRDLKSIPVAIIKKLSVIPDKYLEFLSQKDHITEFPIAVRRQAWNKNVPCFIQYISDLTNGHSKTDRIANTISEMIGDSDRLLVAFADHCVTSSAASQPDCVVDWSGLLLDVFVELYQRKLKNVNNDKLGDLVSLVDRCRRKGRADYTDLGSLFDILRSLITLQTSALNKMYHARSLSAVGTNNSSSSRPAQSAGDKRKQPFDALATQEKRSKTSPLSVDLKTALKFLTRLDTTEIFANKVTDSIAPNYSKIVRYPMSLASIAKKIETGLYDSLSALDKDVRLMFSNCVLYNGVSSELGQLAQKFAGKWQNQYKLMMDREQTASSGQSSRPESEEEVLLDPNIERARGGDSLFHREVAKARRLTEDASISEKERLRRVLLSALDYTATLDQFGLFATPVSDTEVPEYSKIVSRKMAFSDMRKKVASGVYVSMVPFDADMMQIAHNCALFNVGNPPILLEGEKLRNGWSALYTQLQSVCPHLMTSLKQNNLQTTTVVHTSSERTSRVGFHRSDGSAIQIKKILSVAAVRDSVIGLEGPAALRRALQDLWRFAGELDEQGFFASPVQVEGYQEVVASPMDLSLIKRRLERNVYRTLEPFEVDLSRISENCFLFNEDHSDVFKAAERLQYGIALSLRNIKLALSPLSDGEEAVLGPDHLLVVDSHVPMDDEPSSKGDNCQLSIEVEVEVSHKSPAAPELSSVSSAPSAPLVAENAVVPTPSEEPTTADVAEVVAPISKPTFDELLRSSRNAFSAIQSTGAASKIADLPELFTDSKLSWAAVVLSDARLQDMLCKLLAERLFEMGAAAVDVKSVLVNTSVVMPILLPHSDPLVRALCQLCQMALRPFSFRFRAVEDALTRVQLPDLLYAFFSEQVQLRERVADEVKSSGASVACGKISLELVRTIHKENDQESDKMSSFLVSIARHMLQINFERK